MPATKARAWTVFLIFLRLGLTSFGGPIAHLGYFRTEFVERRRWLTERSYADLVALCQFLPGPASSQVGMAIGLTRAGYAGAFGAWAGFTLPSALALIAFALGLQHFGEAVPQGVLHGLKIAAVAVVAQAVWSMGRSLCPDGPRITLMALATCLVLWQPSAWGQIGVIAIAAVVGLWWLRMAPESAHESLQVPLGRRSGLIWLSMFGLGLVSLPLLAAVYPAQWLQLVEAFFRVGSLVFGGGHVVLPLLQAEVVPNGWVNESDFLAGYGAAQAVPGPLFTFSAFLGASVQGSPSGVMGGLLCLVAIFLPSFLLVAGALPFWEQLRAQPRARAALAGVNAAVVGILLAALYQTIWTSTIQSPPDFAVALLALVALMFWKAPPWLTVLGCAVGGGLLGLIG